jgi:hypothetical protein
MTSLAEDAGPNPHGADADVLTLPILTWEVPLRLDTLSNAKGHWRTRYSRAKEQRSIAEFMTWHALRENPVKPPFRITITRIGKRKLDSDNLQGSAKHVRDGIADALQISDGDESAAEWIVLQEIGKSYGVRVRIEGKSNVG